MRKNTFGVILCALLMMVSTQESKAQISIDVRKVTTMEMNVETGDSANYVEERHPGGFDFSIGFLQNRFSKGRGTTCVGKEAGWGMGILGNVGVGFTATLGAPAGMNTNMGSSVEVDWSNVVGIMYKFNRNHRLELGFGMMWRNWRMTGRTQFVQATDGQIDILPYPSGANPEFSRLHSFMLTIPLTYTYKWKHGWKVFAGPELCLAREKYNTIKTRYELDGEKYKDYTKNVHFNPVTVNLVGGVMYKCVGIYARYSPMHVLNTDFGPSFQSLSVGFRFGW